MIPGLSLSDPTDSGTFSPFAEPCTCHQTVGEPCRAVLHVPEPKRELEPPRNRHERRKAAALARKESQ